MTDREGRPVPPHGSGPATYEPRPHEKRTCLDYRRSDPDETMGRVLYRRQAEAEARRSISLGRRVQIIEDGK